MPRKGQKIHKVQRSVTEGASRARLQRQRAAIEDARRARRMADEQAVSHAVAIYRAERKAAERRWEKQGGPSCGFTSGRHPIVWGAGGGIGL